MNEASSGTSALSAGLGTPLAEETDVERLRDDVDFLWSLLDDIDTASDMAKDNDKWYRARVEAVQGKRHQRVASDGYKLFVVPNVKLSGLRGSHKPHELATMFDLSRQQIHNILRQQDPLQMLLDRAVYHSNKAFAIEQEIRKQRGDKAPVCFGQDDCSTETLSHCPWRMDCGK